MSALSFAPPRGAPAKGPVHLQGVWLGHQLCDAASAPTQPTGHSTLEQFADMYGMDPRSTGQQLERARKLAAAAQGNPSASAPAV